MYEEEDSYKLSIKCGKNTDSIEKLEELCRDKIEKLIEIIHIPENTTIHVPCWTSNAFAELICVGHIRKKGDGTIEYELDNSESTL